MLAITQKKDTILKSCPVDLGSQFRIYRSTSNNYSVNIWQFICHLSERRNQIIQPFCPNKSASRDTNDCIWWKAQISSKSLRIYLDGICIKIYCIMD